MTDRGAMTPDQAGERMRRDDQVADAVLGVQTCPLVDPELCWSDRDGWFRVIPDPPEMADVWELASGQIPCVITRDELRLALRACEAFGGFQWAAMAERWGRTD